VEVEVEKGVPYRRPRLIAVQLSSEVYSTPAVKVEDYDVMYSINGVLFTFNIQYAPNL
jgi:hypothetical protein